MQAIRRRTSLVRVIPRHLTSRSRKASDEFSECGTISAKAMSRAETDKAEIAHACMKAISELDGSIGRSPRTRETKFPECPGENNHQGIRTMGYVFGKRAYVNGSLIALNVLYFLYLELTGSSLDAGFMYEHGAMAAEAVLEGNEYYRLVTAMFMHFGIRHIVNNMIILFALGDNLERALGHLKYLIFYLACGIGSNWVSMMLEPRDIIVISAGASGAIFGVIGGLLYAVLINKGQLEDLSSRQLIVMIVLSLCLGLTEQGVDNAAHISGLLIGIVLGAVLYRKRKKNAFIGGIENEER